MKTTLITMMIHKAPLYIMTNISKKNLHNKCSLNFLWLIHVPSPANISPQTVPHFKWFAIRFSLHRPVINPTVLQSGNDNDLQYEQEFVLNTNYFSCWHHIIAYTTQKQNFWGRKENKSGLKLLHHIYFSAPSLKSKRQNN